MEAVNHVKDRFVVGLGSGSTAAYMIKEIGRRVSENSLHVLAVPSSSQAMLLAASSGVPVTTLDEHPVLDLVIDGADEIDPNFDMIKGGGGALLREKIVASSAKQVVIVADETKLVEKLGKFKVPVEVLPFGLAKVTAGIKELGGIPIVREGQRKMGPVVTDNGNYIVDADFGLIDNAKKLDKQLKMIPGVLETGLFIGLAHIVYLGKKDGITKLKK
ncbi:MAG: ribose-5-phosphate isomerase RpiA [Candidatus Bathyarchaeota archaeon]|nr:MAG: ribose-5-phosphate isomerase RpiA [Candidatus Bathyarchaeota archaeon]